ADGHFQIGSNTTLAEIICAIQRHGNEAGEKLRLEREAKARVQQAVAACMKVLKLSSMSKDSHVSWSEMEVACQALVQAFEEEGAGGEEEGKNQNRHPW
ncbi:unnamed protein product, partial [Heterosigma akashiwo]